MRIKMKTKARMIVGAIGIFIILAIVLLTGKKSLLYAESIMKSAADTLRHQCVSFNNLKTEDRTESLFVLYEYISELNKTLERDGYSVDDNYLEEYVKNKRVTGVALLDENLVLEASGYTRDFRKSDWKDDFYTGCFEELREDEHKVFLQRIKFDDQYYDVCAMARRDGKGVVVAYYKQPMNLIYDTEKDLANLLDGTYMELDGDFIIEHEGHIVSEARKVADSEDFVAKTQKKLAQQGLTRFKYDEKTYLGTRSVVGGYSIYVFCPITTVFHNTVTAVLVSVLAYAGIWLIMEFVRTRSTRERQRKLEEANEKLTETVNSLQSLKSIYFAIFRADLKKNTYKSVFMAPWIAKFIDSTGNFEKTAQLLCERFVAEAYKEDVLEHLKFDYIQTRLSAEKLSDIRHSFYVDFESRRGDEARWSCLTVTVADADEKGVPLSVLIMIHDITDEKTKEMGYRQRILEESEAARVAARSKSAFLFNMSHDLRTPLNAILGYTDLAKKYKDNSEKFEDYMKNIRVSGEKMLVLINEILEVARIESNQLTLKLTSAKSGEVTDNCVMMLLPAMDEKKQRFTLEKNIIYPYVILDYYHMLQVMLNLLGNAVKFTPEGGRIRLSLNQYECDENGVFTTEIVVSDTGIGISEDFLPHIFENFAREDSPNVKNTIGSGLGLGIVKTLVELMEGTIEVESRRGKGSTFTVRVPGRVDGEFKSSEEDGEDNFESKTRVKRILLAEDNALNAEIATELLKERGFEVEWVRDGCECIKKLERAPYKYYSLVLTDIQMPNKDGYETAKEIRKMKKSKKGSIPIVAMTANAFPEDKKKALECGMNDHVGKPIDIGELMRVLKKYVI